MMPVSSRGKSDTSESPFRSFWDTVLNERFWFTLSAWYDSFGMGDDARLVQRSLHRECQRSDIELEKWTEFFRELMSPEAPADPFHAIERVLSGPRKARYFLPGKIIAWFGDVCHYARIDRFNEQSLRFPIGGDTLLGKIADAIEHGSISGSSMEGNSIGVADRPLWITDITLTEEATSDVARNRLGLRSLNQPGNRLVEVRYRAAYLQQKGVQIKAPTVLDAWHDGPRRSWIFTKRPGTASEPEPGRTVAFSGDCRGIPGVIEGVHAPLLVLPTEGSNFALRVLRPTAELPPEQSLAGLLENDLV